jgi:hypothetical protein
VNDGRVYAGGEFTTIGEVSANHISQWDGQNWKPLGSGVNDSVNALALIGSDVHAGGWFNRAGGRQSFHFGTWHEPAVPVLAIFRTPTNPVAVSWPSASPGWILQQSTNIVGSPNWSNVTTTIQDDGTTKSIIVNPPTGNRFYRLHKP